MSESVQDKKNLPDMPTLFRNGEEPTGLLLALIWSPTETLMKRGEAKLYRSKNGTLYIALANTSYEPGRGIVKSVDKP